MIQVTNILYPIIFVLSFYIFLYFLYIYLKKILDINETKKNKPVNLIYKDKSEQIKKKSKCKNSKLFLKKNDVFKSNLILDHKDKILFLKKNKNPNFNDSKLLNDFKTMTNDLNNLKQQHIKRIEDKNNNDLTLDELHNPTKHPNEYYPYLNNINNQRTFYKFLPPQSENNLNSNSEIKDNDKCNVIKYSKTHANNLNTKNIPKSNFHFKNKNFYKKQKEKEIIQQNKRNRKVEIY